jgi:hypothetical protein
MEHRSIHRRGRAVEQFIHRENLALYRRKLAEVKDEPTRDVLRKLLVEEEAQDLFKPAAAPLRSK